MEEPYLPPSDFLRAVVADEAPLSGSAFADTNFHRLLDMMRDQDRANRDWATLLISQQEVDTAEVRDALFNAAQDEDEAVRAEAILGLAMRDPEAALPFIKFALKSRSVMPPVFEAAVIVAHRSLVDDLLYFREPSGNAHLDQLAEEAFIACDKSSAP